MSSTPKLIAALLLLACAVRVHAQATTTYPPEGGITFGLSAVGAAEPKLTFGFPYDDTHGGAKYYFNLNGSAVFSGTRDPVFNIGYNIAANGNRVVASEPAFYQQWEADYNGGDGFHYVEWFLAYIGEDGTARRPLSWSSTRSTHSQRLGFAANAINIFSGDAGRTQMASFEPDLRFYIYGDTGVNHNVNNKEFIRQRYTGGSLVSLLYIDNADKVQLGPAGYHFPTKVNGMAELEPFIFFNLGDVAANGTITYCSNCTKTTPCAAGGTGALAKRLNGAWDCN